MFKLFFWKNNKIIDGFAISLADELYSHVQPDAMEAYIANKKNKEAKKPERKIKDIIEQFKQFKTIKSLGIYGKARLHLTFTERLKELGYEKDLANKINEIILLKTP